MKIRLFSIVLMCVFASACSKNDSGSTGAVDNTNYSGTYKGVLTEYTNNVVTRTINDTSIVLVHNPSTTLVTLPNNVSGANTGKIVNGVLTLNKKVNPTSITANTEEYGAAIMTNISMSMDFFVDQVDVNSGSLVSRKKYSGNLMKQ